MQSCLRDAEMQVMGRGADKCVRAEALLRLLMLLPDLR